MINGVVRKSLRVGGRDAVDNLLPADGRAGWCIDRQRTRALSVELQRDVCAVCIRRECYRTWQRDHARG